jgi:hypothetical protein
MQRYGTCKRQCLHPQKLFHEAIIYGKSIMIDPKKKEAYQAVAEEGQSVFNVAVADFLNAPPSNRSM